MNLKHSNLKLSAAAKALMSCRQPCCHQEIGKVDFDHVRHLLVGTQVSEPAYEDALHV